MTSSLPNVCRVVSTRAFTSVSLETSTFTAIALMPNDVLYSFSMMETALSAAGRLMSARTTFAPSEAKSRADSSPMPLLI